jgi:hypothetical protein
MATSTFRSCAQATSPAHFPLYSVILSTSNGGVDRAAVLQCVRSANKLAEGVGQPFLSSCGNSGSLRRGAWGCKPGTFSPGKRAFRPAEMAHSPDQALGRINRTAQACCRPLGTNGRERRRMPEASKMALLMAGATAMMGVSPAPAGAMSLRSIRMASTSGRSRKRGTR